MRARCSYCAPHCCQQYQLFRSWFAPCFDVDEGAGLVQPDDLEAESILFRIRLLAHSAKNLFGIPANRSKARRWVLLGQLNHAHRGLGGGEPAVREIELAEQNPAPRFAA